ncbi:MAG: O-antigen ligase family protein [Planctomycetota bacterium]|jgi:tetratricopeptide (TPR) repeat protein
MRENGMNPDIAHVPDSFDRVIEWLLISLLAFMPLALGVVEAWSEEVVVAFAAVISICFLLKILLRKDADIVWSWSYIPVVLFILIAVFQLIPLPTGVVSTVSPNTSAIKKELLGDLPNSGELLSSMTLSFYTNATKHDLRLVLAVAAVFIIVLNVFRQPEQVKRLLTAIAVIGGSIALIALAQVISGTDKVYWYIPSGHDFAVGGTFINHSNYSQFMSLSIGAALALVLVKVHETFTGKKVTPPLVFEYLGSPAAKAIWLLIGMVIIGVTTIFVSLSRGGVVSMLIAAGFTTMVLTSRQSLKGRGWIMALMALGAFICVLYVGFDAVYDRLATLRDLQEAEGGRWQIVKDISVAWTKFPVLGTGLGTHEVVYPMFDRSTIAAVAAHAENEYAQAAEETGLTGLVVLTVFAVIVWVNYTRNIRTGSVPIRSAAYGLGFGLVAILIHSLSDFGQHLPANAAISAVFCALLLGLARMKETHGEAAHSVRNRKHWNFRGISVAVLVCASGIWAWALMSADNARIAEGHWKEALIAERDLIEKNWQGTNQEYVEIIFQAATAAEYQPENVNYQHWLNVYRWHSISRKHDPNTGEVIVAEQSVQFIPRIIDELHKGRVLCPTFGAAYCVAGQLEKFVLNDPNGIKHIQTGYSLAPCDPTACFVAGLLDAEEQKFDDSLEKFRRAIELDGRLFRDASGVYLNHISRPDLAVALAGDNTRRLSFVVNALGDMEEHKELADKTREQVKELLISECSKPDAPAWAFADLANIYRKESNQEKAVEYYQSALALNYGQVDWRFNLAKVLADIGKISEAIHEARICLRLRPQFKAAEKLIAELSVLPDALIEEKPAF